MKKIAAFLVLLIFSFRLFAQIDYLEPVRPFSQYTGEIGEYYRNVFSLLHTGFQKQPYACFTVIPSFSPEYSMSVEKRKGRCYLISNTLSRTYWQADKGTVKVSTHSIAISQSLYQSLGAVFRLATDQIQDLDGTTAGLDGIAYYFSSTDTKGVVTMGRKWLPKKETLMGRLVLICESAYLLSTGGNISEKALKEEATILLTELRERVKKYPNAYKQPIYVGIYDVGHKQYALSGKLIEKEPRLQTTRPENYVLEQMVYPKKLLTMNIQGYVLCEFTVDKDGVVLRPHILYSTHPEFAEEVLRVVKQMPIWIPASIGGKSVESNYTLYVPFRPQIYRDWLRKK